MMYGTEKYFTAEKAKQEAERTKKAEAVSCELLEKCEEKGLTSLTIAEVLEWAHSFPQQVEDKIRTIEKRTDLRQIILEISRAAGGVTR